MEKVKYLVIVFLFFYSVCFAQSSGGPAMKIETLDGSVTGRCRTLKVSNDTLVNNGSNTFTLMTGSGGGGAVSSVNEGVTGPLVVNPTTGDIYISIISADATTDGYIKAGDWLKIGVMSSDIITINNNIAIISSDVGANKITISIISSDMTAKQNAITGDTTNVLFFDGANNPKGDAGMTYAKNTDALTLLGSLTTGSSGQSIIQGGLVVNEASGGADTDTFRVEGNSDANLISCDVANDRVGIGTATPGYKLEVNGSIKATDYYAGDATQGASTSVGGLTFKDGLFTTGSIATTSKVVILKPYDYTTSVVTQDAVIYFTIPQELGGMSLVTIGAHVYTASSSGPISVDVVNSSDSVSMLSNDVAIDVNEKDSSTAAVVYVISDETAMVQTADEIMINVDAAGSGAKGLEVRMGFN